MDRLVLVRDSGKCAAKKTKKQTYLREETAYRTGCFGRWRREQKPSHASAA